MSTANNSNQLLQFNLLISLISKKIYACHDVGRNLLKG